MEATLDSLLLGFSVAFQPGVLLYAYMLKKGLIDESIGTAGVEGEGSTKT